MPSRNALSYDMANNCFTRDSPCGHCPDPTLFCPVLPLPPILGHNTRYAPPTPRSTFSMTSSSDSEDDFLPIINNHNASNANDANHNSTHTTLAKIPIQCPNAPSPATSSPSRPVTTTTTTTITLPSRPQPRPHRRIPHTIIERRYRDTLNTSIESLRLTLPTLRDAYACSSQPLDFEDAAAPLPPRLPSKATIIATAATYIKELEGWRSTVEVEMEALRGQVGELQKLVGCSDCGILQYLQQVGGSGGEVQMVG